MKKIFKKIRNIILDLILPIECLNCRREGEYLCEKCFRQLRFNDDNYLEKIKSNLKIEALDRIFIAGNYEDKMLRRLIIKFKYDFVEPLGKILARYLAIFWNSRSLPDADDTSSFLIIPIPLSKKRRRWRGFNQAEILARELGAHFHYDLSLDLMRKKHRTPQAELNETGRAKNIKGAFAWQGGNLSGKTIILIDDVVTTGATLNEAAKILKAAGASKIYGLVLAKG